MKKRLRKKRFKKLSKILNPLIEEVIKNIYAPKTAFMNEMRKELKIEQTN